MITKVSDRTAKRRLLELAELLGSDAVRNHFDFGSYGHAKNAAGLNKLTSGGRVDLLKNADACGTVACAAGWVPALPFAKRLGYQLVVTKGRVYGYFVKNGRKTSTPSMYKELFGLSSLQSDQLFMPGCSLLNRGLCEDSDPDSVAENIRDFVKVRFG